MPPQKPQQSSSDAIDLWRLSGLGLEFVASIVGGGVIGWLLDRWLGTGPWLLVAGLLAGLLGGSYNFFRDAMAASRRAQAAYRRSHPASGNRPASERPARSDDEREPD